MGTAVSGGLIYIAGGWHSGPLNDIMEIDPSGSAISVRNRKILDNAFADISLIAGTDNLYIIGGTEPRYKRQLRIIRISKNDFSMENLVL